MAGVSMAVSVYVYGDVNSFPSSLKVMCCDFNDIKALIYQLFCCYFALQYLVNVPLPVGHREAEPQQPPQEDPGERELFLRHPGRPPRSHGAVNL